MEIIIRTGYLEEKPSLQHTNPQSYKWKQTKVIQEGMPTNEVQETLPYQRLRTIVVAIFSCCSTICMAQIPAWYFESISRYKQPQHGQGELFLYPRLHKRWEICFIEPGKIAHPHLYLILTHCWSLGDTNISCQRWESLHWRGSICQAMPTAISYCAHACSLHIYRVWNSGHVRLDIILKHRSAWLILWSRVLVAASWEFSR